MNTVNTINIKSEIAKFHKYLQDYENVYLNLYNDLNYSQKHWFDFKSMRFYEDAHTEKLKLIKNYNELTKYKEIFNYIYSGYSKLGKIINFDLKMKNPVMNSISACIESLKEVINNNNSVDIGSAPEVATYISSNTATLSKMQTSLLALKNKLKKDFENIEEFERTVKSKLGNLEIAYLKEKNERKYI